MINVPVREDGRNVALLLVHFSHPHDWLMKKYTGCTMLQTGWNMRLPADVLMNSRS
ncbi:hypothetical protein [Asaia prunellae]|uniref:hypothetical protein n=1 Tax=Asaia prunellae TaxID=610245 RepID=UPI000ADD5DB9|nr:hypothetical protein [Asaia prunellae]